MAQILHLHPHAIYLCGLHIKLNIRCGDVQEWNSLMKHHSRQALPTAQSLRSCSQNSTFSWVVRAIFAGLIGPSLNFPDLSISLSSLFCLSLNMCRNLSFKNLKQRNYWVAVSFAADFFHVEHPCCSLFLVFLYLAVSECLVSDEAFWMKGNKIHLVWVFRLLQYFCCNLNNFIPLKKTKIIHY